MHRLIKQAKEEWEDLHADDAEPVSEMKPLIRLRVRSSQTILLHILILRHCRSSTRNRTAKPDTKSAIRNASARNS